MSEVIETDFYMVVAYNPRAGYSRALSIRTTKNRPALAKGEIAIKCTIALPKALFQRPALSARISIPDEAVPRTEINMELASNIQDLVQQHLGLEMTIGVSE